MNVMDTVSRGQELTIGKYKCKVYQSGSAWWCINSSSDFNSALFRQFGITPLELENLLDYKTSGSFPKCKSAEDLTKVIEFIISKDPANKPKEEDYTGRTIKALVDDPFSTGVRLGEEIKILKKLASDYILDETANGITGQLIEKPLNLKQWKLLPEEKTIKPESSKYTKGKWYTSAKWYETSYIKLDYIKDDQAFFTEKISDTGYECKKDWWSMVGYKLLEADMDKVSTYLPDGHPDKLSKPSIPEYVECIDSSLSQAKKGKIYPVISSQKCICENNKEYFWNTCEFKPSTKEAYDAQFRSTTEEEYVPKVGDNIVYNEKYVLSITEVKSDSYHDYWVTHTPMSFSGGGFGWKAHKSKIRKALPHEIPSQKSITSEWEAGTYAVGLKGNFGIFSGSENLVSIGKVYTLYTLSRGTSITEDNIGVEESQYWVKKDNLKWFARKEEAEAFARTLTKSSEEPVYAYVGDPLPTIKTKPLIEDVQSVSVKLSTRKNNNKFKF